MTDEIDVTSETTLARLTDQGWVWAPRLDPDCGEYGLFVNQGNRIIISSGSPSVAITGARIILNNHFAKLPICGHSYATAQFIGRGPTEVSFQLASIGDDVISDIQGMHEELEENARLYRRFKGAARVRFSDNEFLRLAGIYDGIITSIDTETDKSGTNLFRAQISFTSDGHHTERFRQEMYTDSNITSEILEALLQRVNINELDRAQSLQVVRSADTLFTPEIRNALNYIPGLEGIATRLIADNLSNAVSGYRESVGLSRASNVTSVDGILESIQSTGSSLLSQLEDVRLNSSSRREGNARRAGYLQYPVMTPVPEERDITAEYSPSIDREHSWVNEYVIQLVEKITEWRTRLPGREFFIGDHRGRYITLHNRGPAGEEGESEGVRTTFEPEEGFISNWPPLLGDRNSALCSLIMGTRRRWRSATPFSSSDVDSIERALFNFEEELRSIAESVRNNCMGRPDFRDIFPGVLEDYINSPRTTAHTTYPDIGLPPHPATHLEIDTEPDFYFFNDGEEGMLNEIGPEITQEIDERLRNVESSFLRLASGQEWSETYLGRSRIGVTTQNGDTDYNEDVEPSLDPNDPYQSIEGSTSASINPNTVNGNAGWGADGRGRTIGGGSSFISESIVDIAIGLSPTIRSSDTADKEELRRRRINMMRNTSLSLPSGDHNTGIQIGPIDSVLGDDDATHSFSRNAINSVVLQSIAQAPETTLTMRRAFPTFKIYFIEDDIGARANEAGAHYLPINSATGRSRPVMYFDDLYSYNSVKSIRLIRSRKNPADLLVLQLTNVQGLLERRTWDPRTGNNRERELYAPGFEETELENPLKKIIMKEGLKVQARLGNSSNPHKLGNKFIGEVVEYSFNADSSDEVTIICQSYGSELVLDRKGAGPDAQFEFFDTPDLLHTLMCSPELVHFGRYNLNPQFNPGEARSAATSRNDPTTTNTGTLGSTGGTGLLSNPRARLQNLQDILCINRSKWIIANNPSDDNIFAPGVRDDLTKWEQFENDLGSQIMWSSSWIRTAAETAVPNSWMTWVALPSVSIQREIISLEASIAHRIGSWLNNAGIALTGQTIWETIKECELRHPGWIGHPRPYGTRMTMFFGVPSHKYWADEISREEMATLQVLREQMSEYWNNRPAQAYQTALRVANGNLRDVNIDPTGSQLATTIPTAGLEMLTTLSADARNIFIRTCRELAINRYLSNIGESIGATFGRFKPFRRYHLITSDHHILMNNIRASQKGVFNAVTVKYGEGELYTLKADDSIPDEKTFTQVFNYPSCKNETMARRYCIGLLNRHLKDVYKGEIVVTGMDVDPYDICYLHDEKSDLYGMFEIEQVVDTFTPETGWITEITPDLITGTNEWSTSSTSQARAAVLGTLSQRYLGKRLTALEAAGALVLGTAASGALGAGVAGVPGAAVGLAGAGVVSAGAALAWIGGYYFIRWTQNRQPIWVCPLILGERPFFSGLDGFRQDGIFASVRGQFNAEFDAIREGWRRFHLAGYANDITISIAQSLSGQTGQ